jgi:hypothetical protein
VNAPPRAFFERTGEHFASTELTRGPWDPESQHAGPPVALIGRAIENLDGAGGSPEGRLVGRITFEILRPVPIAELSVRAEIVRPGRRVDLAEATLSDAAGEPLIRARAWRLRLGEVAIPDGLGSEDRGPGPGPPDALDADAEAFFPTEAEVGYHTGMEYRFASGGFTEPGPAVCWMRMREPLIAGERPTPLQRVLIAADSGNGVSGVLDFDRYLFINTDLTVALHRYPDGEWVCLDAITRIQPHGIGLAETQLFDERGLIGRGLQSLFVARR